MSRSDGRIVYDSAARPVPKLQHRRERRGPPPSRRARLANATHLAVPLIAIAAIVTGLLVAFDPASRLQIAIDVGGFLFVAIGVGWHEGHRGRRHRSTSR